MKNDLEQRTKHFALAVISLVSSLPKSKAADVIGYQLLKSGTSVGANYREARRAQSRTDFVHKLAICEKEAAETEYWLELLADSDLASIARLEPLLNEVRQLIAIIASSAKTAKAGA